MWIYIITGIGVCMVIFFIAIKLYFLKKSLKEIRISLGKILKTEYEIKDNEVVFTKGKSGKTAELKSVIKTIKDALNDYDFKNKIEYKPVDHDLTKDKEMEIFLKTCMII